MCAKLPIFSLLWLLCGSPTPADADAQPLQSPPAASPGTHPAQSSQSTGQPQLAKTTLEQAILTLEGYNSVSAKIRHTSHLFGKRLVGSGKYDEQRPGSQNPHLRMELKIQIGDQVSSFLQVCDGQYLWTYRKLLDDGKLSRVNIIRVIEALERAEETPLAHKIGQWPALGGLPRLLRGLQATFDFTSIQQTQIPDGHSDQLPVWKLRGQWKPEKLAKVFSKDEKTPQQGSFDLSTLPPHLPDHVVLFLGTEHLFPYRIEYRRSAPRVHTTVSMQLYEVRFNAPTHSTQFIYNPGDLEPSDQTEAFLESLGLKE